MKKIILVFALLVGLSGLAQDFPGEKIELLKDKTLVVLPKKESLQSYGYQDFYTDEALTETYAKKGFTTTYSALVGKEFKVLSYEPLKGIASAKYVNYKILIENPETGKLYFKYDSKYDFLFPFSVVGGLEFPEGHFCDLIVKESASSSISYTTPNIDGAYIVKEKGSKVLAYVFKYANEEKYDAAKIWKGITLVFENGAKIAVPTEKIESTKSSSGKTILSVGLIVHEAKYLSLLKEQQVKSIVFDKLEKEFKGGKTLQEYTKCLLSKLQ